MDTDVKTYCATVVLACSLTGCLATARTNSGMPLVVDDSIPAAIRQHEKTYPSTVRTCVLLDDAFSYAKGRFDVDRKAYGVEEREARWDHLARLGLFLKSQSKTVTTYTITALGKQSYSDEKCSSGANFSQVGGASLTYGVLEFDRVVKQKYFPDAKLTALEFRKRFTKLADWAKDKDLRRAWKLPGIEDIENMQWNASTKRTSNGIEFIDAPQLNLFQR